MAVFVIHWENCLLRYIHRECAERERERVSSLDLLNSVKILLCCILFTVMK